MVCIGCDFRELSDGREAGPTRIETVAAGGFEAAKLEFALNMQF